MIKIPEEILTLDLKLKTDKPEIDALNYYKKHDWDGINDEGEMFFLLLKCSCFLELPSTAYQLSKGELPPTGYQPSKDNNLNYFGVYHRRITEQMCLPPDNRRWPFSEWGTVEERIVDIKNITLELVLHNFNLIKKYTYCGGFDNTWYLYYQKYLDSQIADVFCLLGNDVLAEIFSIACGMRGDKVRHDVGWPDLMLYNKNEIIFREVKTINDKMSKNQINVYSDVFNVMDLDYKILRLLYE